MYYRLIKIVVLLLFCCGSTYNVSAQVSQKIGIAPFNKNSSAVLELESTSKGFLPPRMTTIQRDAVVSPAKGLIIYNTDTDLLEMNAGTAMTAVWEVTTGAFAAPLWTVGNYVAHALVTHTDGQVYRANSNMTSGVTSFIIGTAADQWTVVASSAVASDWVGSKYYAKNQLVVYSDGFVYRANEIIPETESIFLTGTSGATWAPVNIPTAPLWTARYYPKYALVTHTDGLVYKANSEMLPTVTSFVEGTAADQWTLVGGLSSSLPSGKVFVGNASNVATAVSITGDVTISNTGVTTIGADKVTTSKILDGSVNTADLANNAVTSAKILDGSVSTADIAVNAITSSKIASSSISASKIDDNNVTYAKMQASTQNILLGNASEETDNVSFIEAGSAFDMLVNSYINGDEGYIDIGNSRIVWGKNTEGTDTVRTTTLAGNFSNTSYCVLTAAAVNNGDYGRYVMVYDRTTSSFKAIVQATDNTSSVANFYYIAIGTKP
jgi:hypothetical protein